MRHEREHGLYCGPHVLDLRGRKACVHLRNGQLAEHTVLIFELFGDRSHHLLLRALSASILHINSCVDLFAVVYPDRFGRHRRLHVWVLAAELILQKTVLALTLRWMDLTEAIDKLLIVVAIFFSLLELYGPFPLLGRHYNINFELL